MKPCYSDRPFVYISKKKLPITDSIYRDDGFFHCSNTYFFVLLVENMESVLIWKKDLVSIYVGVTCVFAVLCQYHKGERFIHIVPPKGYFSVYLPLQQNSTIPM